MSGNQEIEPEVRDAGILAAVQSIELWMVSKLGSIRAFAEDLGHHEASDTLAELVENEGRFNREFTRLAECTINFDAADV